ncbi:MAG: extracellular solute-binding protein [Fibrobacterota bacterium]
MTLKTVLILFFLLPFGLLTLGGCGKGESKAREYTVLLKMLPDQEKFFRNEILTPFERLNNCKINIVQFDKMWYIETALDLQKEKTDPSIILVKVPFEMTRVLVGKNLLQPLDSVVPATQLEQDLAEYHPLAMGMGYVDGKPYYIPRKLETRVLFYLKSKVNDAVANWKKFEKDLNKVLKEQNGYGLPKGYALEAETNQWDAYDIFVMGWYWAHTKYFDNNVLMPRIAHRGDKYEGTALGLVDGVLQFGASSDDILKMNSEAAIDMFTWEAAYIKNGIFNPDMWNSAWRGPDIYKGIADGKVFLTVFQQIDCFNVHGWEENPEMRGYLKDPEDMGIATMPTAVSFALNPDGTYKRIGTKKISTGGWWWGIPRTSPDKDMAYKLTRFITNRDNQAIECTKYGMISVRKDILSNISETFSMGWVGEIFQVSVMQLDLNGLTTVPLVKEYSEIGKTYNEAWYELCVDKFGKTTRDKVDAGAIQAALNSKYNAQARQILKDGYPKK